MSERSDYAEERTFVLRVTLRAEFDDDYEGDDDGYAWARAWSEQVRPRLVAGAFDVLRAAPGWRVRVLNRGKPAEDEVEILVERTAGDGGRGKTIERSETS